MITLCHRLRSKFFTNFSSCLELYLYQDDARRRVIDILNKLDLTISYDTIFRRLTFLVAEIERRVVTLRRLFSTIVTYDNFDYVVSRREKRVENAREVKFITTTLIFEKRDFVMKAFVGSSQPVAPIVSSYTTTTVRELNDDSYSFYLDDLATDLYSSFHHSLHHSSSVIIVHLDSSHARDVIIMWALFSLVTIMMLVDRFMKKSCEKFKRWRRRLLLMTMTTS
jgi:hypothetical protein